MGKRRSIKDIYKMKKLSNKITMLTAYDYQFAKILDESGIDVILVGDSCPMLAVAEASDLVLLVAEPTPFGLHDLLMAIRAVRQLEKPMAVLINRSDWGDGSVRKACRDEGIPIALEIPHSMAVAKGYAKALPLVVSDPSFRPALEGMRAFLRELARETAA